MSIKIDTSSFHLCNAFLKNGFYLVDTLVSYKFDYQKDDIPLLQYSDEIIIAPVKENDVDDICKIAYSSFYNDRYHNDPNLSDKACNLYYERWVRNSYQGFADIILIAKDYNNHVLGFVTGKFYDENESCVVLNAVTEFARGKGVYTNLIINIINHFKGKSRYLLSGTQINNYAVHKTWNKLKFKIYSSKYVLHKQL